VVFAMCWTDLGETNKSPSETFMKQFRSYPELFRSRRFWGYALCMMFSTGAFYAFLAGAPLLAEALFGMSPAALGFCLGTITAGFAMGSYLSGRFAQRHSLVSMMIAGRLVACAGLLAGLALLLAGFVHPAALFGATIFVGIGNGLTMPSSNAGALSVRPELAGSAAGLSGALTVAAGALLTLLTGAVLTTENGAYALLGMMLLCTVLALLAALQVLRLDLDGEPENQEAGA
jgi:MFS transporter, DHA1 family, multidrug resistance protein